MPRIVDWNIRRWIQSLGAFGIVMSIVVTYLVPGEPVGDIQSVQLHQRLKRARFDPAWRDYLNLSEFNYRSALLVEQCINESRCRRNQAKVIILAWHHFRQLMNGVMTGENVWCDSMMDAFHMLGYTMFIAEGEDHMRQIYRTYHQYVQFIIADPNKSHDCIFDPTCSFKDGLSETRIPNPNDTHSNIPVWKFLQSIWWNFPAPPFGGPFTLAPEDCSLWPAGSVGTRNQCVGYSVEKTCLRTSWVPFQDRSRQAYILGKYLGYFSQYHYVLGHEEDPYESSFHSQLTVKANMTFVSQLQQLTDDGLHPPSGIERIPPMPRQEFQKLLARSRVVLGIGSPALSPTPYEALCLGVPFINPIHTWDAADPTNKVKWGSQHDGLLRLGFDEPFVYHIKQGDREGLERAIFTALDTPIQRTIPRSMTLEAVRDRLEALAKIDWRLLAREQVEAKGFGV